MSDNTFTPARNSSIAASSIGGGSSPAATSIGGGSSLAATPIGGVSPAATSIGNPSFDASFGTPIIGRDSSMEQATPIQGSLSDISMQAATPISGRSASPKRSSIRRIAPVVDRSSDSSIQWEPDSSGEALADTREEQEEGISFEYLLKVAPRYQNVDMSNFAEFCLGEKMTHFKFKPEDFPSNPEKDKEAIKSNDNDEDKATKAEIIRLFNKDKKHKKAARGFVESVSIFYNLISAFFSSYVSEKISEFYKDEKVPGFDESTGIGIPGSSTGSAKKHPVSEPGFRPVQFIQNRVELDEANPFEIEEYCALQTEVEDFVKNEEEAIKHRKIQVKGFFYLLLDLMPLVKKECELDPEGSVKNKDMGPGLERVTNDISRCFRKFRAIFNDISHEIETTKENIKMYEELIKYMASRPLPTAQNIENYQKEIADLAGRPHPKEAFFLFRKEYKSKFSVLKPARILGHVIYDEKNYATRPLSTTIVNQVETFPLRQVTDKGPGTEIHNLENGRTVIKSVQFTEFDGEMIPKTDFQFEVTGSFEYKYLKYRIDVEGKEILLSLPDLEEGCVIPASHLDEKGNYRPPETKVGTKRCADGPSTGEGSAKRAKLDNPGDSMQDLGDLTQESVQKEVEDGFEEYAEVDDDEDSPAASPLQDDELEQEVSESLSNFSVDNS